MSGIGKGGAESAPHPLPAPRLVVVSVRDHDFKSAAEACKRIVIACAIRVEGVDDLTALQRCQGRGSHNIIVPHLDLRVRGDDEELYGRACAGEKVVIAPGTQCVRAGTQLLVAPGP